MEKFVAGLDSSIILGGKNAKAAGRINTIKASYWKVVDMKNSVSFSEREGRWLLCVPIVEKQRRSEHKMWVLAEHDSNYSVHEAPADGEE